METTVGILETTTERVNTIRNETNRRRTLSFCLRYLTAVTALISGSMCGSASAQTSPAVIQDSVKTGQSVSIVNDQGDQFRGRLVAVSTDFLTVEKGRNQTNVRYQDIVKIDRVDDLKNGAMIGLLVGTGLFAIDALVAREDGLTLNAAGYAVVGALYGGLGAAAGAGIDALIGGNRNLYQRGNATRVGVALVLGARPGAVVGVSW